MRWDLVVLCVAAFAVVSLTASLATWLLFPVGDWVARRTAPAHRVWLWFALTAFPGATATVVLAVSFLPAVGLGADHCLEHGLHHPHLCPHHIGGAPGIALLTIAAISSGRWLLGLFELFSMSWRRHLVSRALDEGSELHDGVSFYASEEPNAFVLGKHIYASHALRALPPEIGEAVLAHERAHAERRHPFWRAVALLLSTLHLPYLASALRSRLKTAQEMTADLDASTWVEGGRWQVARAIVKLADVLQRTARSTPSRALAFTEGDLRARVLGLLERSERHSAWPMRLAAAGGLIGVSALGWYRDGVHHGLETLLGFLN